jgi:hypothetical protein
LRGEKKGGYEGGLKESKSQKKKKKKVLGHFSGFTEEGKG